MFHEALDRTTLASRIAALENDNDLLTGDFHPVLDLEQLNLERSLFRFIGIAGDPVGVRVLAFLEKCADGLWVLAKLGNHFGLVGTAHRMILLMLFRKGRCL